MNTLLLTEVAFKAVKMICAELQDKHPLFKDNDFLLDQLQIGIVDRLTNVTNKAKNSNEIANK